MIHESGLTHTARSMTILSCSQLVSLSVILFQRNGTSWLNLYHHASVALKTWYFSNE